MRILADSNIFIDIWNGKDSEKYRQIFEEHDIVVCGVVLAELMQGAYSEKNKREIQETLSFFEQISIPDWEVFGDQLYNLRTHGITVPFQDSLIATIAIQHGVAIWTNDKHFELMKKVLPDLQLVTEDEL